MRLETIETGVGNHFNNDYISSYWNIETENIYKKTLDTFFPNGIRYRGAIKIGDTYSFNNKLQDPKIGSRNEDYSENRTFSVEILLSNQTTGYIDFKTSNKTGEIILTRYDVSGDKFIDSDANYITIIDEIEKVGNLAILKFQLTPLYKTDGYEPIFWYYADNTSLFFIKQYYQEFVNIPSPIYVSDADYSIPVLDSSDFISFMYYASKGIILRNGYKLFTNKDLVDEKYDSIEFSKKIGGNNKLLDYSTLNDFLDICKPGDILIFNLGDLYHALFLIDPIKKEYSECSGWVEFYINYTNNGKINPFNFENRIYQLFQNSTLYHIRLQ